MSDMGYCGGGQWFRMDLVLLQVVGIVKEYFLFDGQVFWHVVCNVYGVT